MRSRLKLFSLLAICVAFLGLSACNSQQPSDQQVKQQAAKTTQDVKAGAQQAAADAKVAAANAERKVNDIAAGVKEGLKSGKHGAAAVDINSATAQQLTDLPGVTPSRAQRIIHGRPYNTPNDLVSRSILTQAEFDRISGQITAQ